ncbi:hypothetical protein D9M70_491260 [compost metagenome]
MRVIAHRSGTSGSGLGAGSNGDSTIPGRLRGFTHGNRIVTDGAGCSAGGVGLEVLGALGDTCIQLIDVDRIGALSTCRDIGDLALAGSCAHRDAVGAVGHRTGAQGHAVRVGCLRVTAEDSGVSCAGQRVGA